MSLSYFSVIAFIVLVFIIPLICLGFCMYSIQHTEKSRRTLMNRNL